MDIEELNRSLLELTESEHRYRAGAQLRWDSLKSAPHESGPYRLDSRVFTSHFGTLIGRGRTPLLLDQYFHMRKQSRFSAVPEHVHDYVEISYVYRGSCRQLVSGQDLLLLENQILLLDSDCPHAIEALGAEDILISVSIAKGFLTACLDESRDRSDWLSDFLLAALDEQADHNRYVIFNSERNRRIRRFFQELMCEYFDPSPQAERIIHGLFLLVLAELMNVYEQDYVREEQRRSGGKVSVITIVRHIQENYLTCTLESVAECFFVTPNYVSRLLKQNTGKTYMQFVQEQRLEHAARLLRSGLYSVEETARAVGYENMSFFYRKFKERYGMTPAEVRR